MSETTRIYRTEIGGGGSAWLCAACYDGMDEVLGAECAQMQREGCDLRPLDEAEDHASCMCCERFLTCPPDCTNDSSGDCPECFAATGNGCGHGEKCHDCVEHDGHEEAERLANERYADEMRRAAEGMEREGWL